MSLNNAEKMDALRYAVQRALSECSSMLNAAERLHDLFYHKDIKTYEQFVIEANRMATTYQDRTYGIIFSVLIGKVIDEYYNEGLIANQAHSYPTGEAPL